MKTPVGGARMLFISTWKSQTDFTSPAGGLIIGFRTAQISSRAYTATTPGHRAGVESIYLDYRKE